MKTNFHERITKRGIKTKQIFVNIPLVGHRQHQKRRRETTPEPTVSQDNRVILNKMATLINQQHEHGGGDKTVVIAANPKRKTFTRCLLAFCCSSAMALLWILDWCGTGYLKTKRRRKAKTRKQRWLLLFASLVLLLDLAFKETNQHTQLKKKWTLFNMD